MGFLTFSFLALIDVPLYFFPVKFLFLCQMSGKLRHAVVYVSVMQSSVHLLSLLSSVITSSSVCYLTGEHDVLKTNEPISIQISTSGRRDKVMKRSTVEGQVAKGQGHSKPKVDWRLKLMFHRLLQCHSQFHIFARRYSPPFILSEFFSLT